LHENVANDILYHLYNREASVQRGSRGA